MRIHISHRDILTTGPLDTYYRVDCLVTFTPGEQINITLHANATDRYAWLHAFWGILLVRLPFEDQGNGVFTGIWSAETVRGFRFAVFDLMTKSTLMNATAPYDCNGWLLPYRIQTAK